MEVFFIVLVASIIDPVRLIPSIIAGAFARTWWHVAIATAIIGGLLLVIANRLGANLNPFMGVLATALTISATFAIKSMGGRRKVKAQASE